MIAVFKQSTSVRAIRLLLGLSFLSCSSAVSLDDDGGASTVPIRRDYAPDWSNDGHRIAYTHAAQNPSELALGKFQIWVATYDTRETRYVCSGANPTWSPDDTEIAFERDGIIWKINIEDLEQEQVSFFSVNADWPNSSVSRFPKWSTDANEILMIHKPDDGLPSEIYTTNLSSGLHRGIKIGVSSAAWFSNDAKSVVFLSLGSDSLFYLDLSDSLSTLLASVPFESSIRLRSPTQIPGDLREVSYVRLGGTNGGIWKTSIESERSTLLVPEAGSHAWSPDANRIVFEEPDSAGAFIVLHLINLDTGERDLLLK